MQQIGMKWPEDLIERVDRAAKEANQTRSGYIRSVVERALQGGGYISVRKADPSLLDATSDEVEVHATRDKHLTAFRGHATTKPGWYWCQRCREPRPGEHFK